MNRDILLIGAARSGTKWLRSLLAASEFIKEVPFDVNFMWRTGQHGYAHDRLDPASCSDERAQRIRQKLHKSAGVQPGDHFLEKTVSNTLRVPFVHRVFPDGKYVHLLRDGRDVIESSFRQWNAPTDFRYLLNKLRHFPLDDWQYGIWFAKNTFFKGGQVPIWGPRYEGIEQDVVQHGVFYACCQQWVRSVELALDDLAKLPQESVITVRYEQMTADMSHLPELIEFLGLEDAHRVLKFHEATVKKGLGDMWRDRLSQEQQDIMHSVAGPTLGKLGYS